MEFILLSFVAGVLTVLAPCAFTLLPIILGGSVAETDRWKPIRIITGLSVSIFLFTLILKFSTALITVPPSFWAVVSGLILVAFGIVTVFPGIWDWVNAKLGLSTKSDQLLHDSASGRKNWLGDFTIGAALGPVFSSCSPTYAVIIATLLPQDLFTGVINLTVYVLGLAVILLLISVGGQSIISRFKWAVNPQGNFKRVLGLLFIIVGLAIMTGFDKQFEAYLIENGILDATQFEVELLENQMGNVN